MTRPQAWLEAHKDYPHEDWCLIWPFSREPRVGRGMMGDAEGGQSRWAHRVMCEMVHGPAPVDKPQASHSCGNGHQGCVNPRHLSWASNSENQLIRYAQGRGNDGANGNRSRFTPQQIETIRSQWGEFTQTKLAEMYGVSLGTIQYYLKYREERGHAGGKITHWTPDEDDMLREGIAKGLNLNQLAKLVGKSHGATSGRVYRLGMKSGQPPTPKKVVAQTNGER